VQRSRRNGLELLVLCALLAGGAYMYYRTRPVLSPERLSAAKNLVRDNAFRVPADSALHRARSIAETLGLPSVSFAVAVDGRVVWEAAVGWADLSSRAGASTDTRYGTGRLAESVTSAILARLVAAGTVDFDSTVRSRVPRANGPVGDITIRQLASHSAGLRGYATRPGRRLWTERFGRHHFETAADALDLFISDSLTAAPGAAYHYSPYDYTLLAAVLEAAADQPYRTLLDQEIALPAGLERTGPDDVTADRPDRAIPYVRIGDRFVTLPATDPSYRWPGSALLTTPRDLALLGAGLMDHAIADSAAVEQLWTPGAGSDDAGPVNYGMGWHIEHESGLIGRADTVRVVYNGDETTGNTSFLLLVPADHVAVAVLTNRRLDNPGPLRREAYWMAGAFARAINANRRSILPLFDSN